MPEQFTESAKQALKLARQTAKACGHSYVGSEHLLLGLLRRRLTGQPECCCGRPR